MKPCTSIRVWVGGRTIWSLISCLWSFMVLKLKQQDYLLNHSYTYILCYICAANPWAMFAGKHKLWLSAMSDKSTFMICLCSHIIQTSGLQFMTFCLCGICHVAVRQAWSVLRPTIQIKDIYSVPLTVSLLARLHNFIWITPLVILGPYCEWCLSRILPEHSYSLSFFVP